MFWFVAVCTVVCAVGGYLIFEASLSLCGPYRHTFLGDIYWYVPLSLLIAQTAVLIVMGRKTHRSSDEVVLAVGAALVVTLIGDVVIFFLYFAAGDCGE
jgi:hypothetical protein